MAQKIVLKKTVQRLLLASFLTMVPLLASHLTSCKSDRDPYLNKNHNAYGVSAQQKKLKQNISRADRKKFAEMQMTRIMQAREQLAQFFGPSANEKDWIKIWNGMNPHRDVSDKIENILANCVRYKFIGKVDKIGGDYAVFYKPRKKNISVSCGQYVTDPTRVTEIRTFFPAYQLDSTNLFVLDYVQNSGRTIWPPAWTGSRFDRWTVPHAHTVNRKDIIERQSKIINSIQKSPTPVTIGKVVGPDKIETEFDGVALLDDTYSHNAYITKSDSSGFVVFTIKHDLNYRWNNWYVSPKGVMSVLYPRFVKLEQETKQLLDNINKETIGR